MKPSAGPPDPPSYTFGPFRLDVGARTLERDGAAVPLLPKSFDALLVLVRNSGRLLEKDFLLAEIWPDTHVEENNLARAVSDIRKALGEGPKDQHYVVTVARRGYRFAAPVTTIAPPPTPLPDARVEVAPEIATTRVPEALSGRRAPFRTAATWVAVVFVTAAIGAGVMWMLTPAVPAPVTRLSFTLPQAQSLSSGDRSVAAIAPDGTQVAYVAAPAAIYLRSMAALESHPIRGTEGLGNLGEPVFSPDGQSIVFHASGDQTLKTIRVDGGVAVTLCRAVFPYGVSWGANGILFVEPGKGVMRVAPAGGEPQVLIRLDAGEAAQSPQFLPDGQHVLFTLAKGHSPDRWDRAAVVVQNVATGQRTTVLEGGSDARYVPTGHLVYALTGNLFAIAFDVARLRTSGAAVPVVEGVRRGAADTTGTAQFSVALNGSLMYVPGPLSGRFDLGLTDIKGTVEPLHLPPDSYEAPRVSPDGGRVAFGTDDGREAAVWIYELSGRAPLRKLTFGGNNRYPTWSPDGTRVTFQSDRDGDAAVFWQPLSGGAVERLTTPRPGESHEPEAWSPDGRVLLFSIATARDVSLWTLTLPSRIAAPFNAVRSSTRTGAVFSNDGRWVAYARSDPSGKTIYVEPFPPTGARHQLVRVAGGQPNHPLWSRDGRRLFYNPGPGRFESVGVVTTPTFAFDTPVVLPRSFPGASLASRRPYDVTPDGRVLSAIAAGQAEARRAVNADIQVVLNWFGDLRARVEPSSE